MTIEEKPLVRFTEKQTGTERTREFVRFETKFLVVVDDCEEKYYDNTDISNLTFLGRKMTTWI